jgi:hypothetical protein
LTKALQYCNMSIFDSILVMLLGDLRQVDWFLPLREWGSPGRSATGGCEQPHFQAAQRRFFAPTRDRKKNLASSEQWETYVGKEGEEWDLT